MRFEAETIRVEKEVEEEEEESSDFRLFLRCLFPPRCSRNTVSVNNMLQHLQRYLSLSGKYCKSSQEEGESEEEEEEEEESEDEDEGGIEAVTPAGR